MKIQTNQTCAKLAKRMPGVFLSFKELQSVLEIVVAWEYVELRGSGSPSVSSPAWLSAAAASERK